MLIISNSSSLMQTTKEMLKEKYDAKELGPVNHILQWKITRTNNTLKISQPACIQQILEEHNMRQCKPMKTPHCTGITLTKQQKGEKELNNDRKHPHQQIVGSLRCLADSTRPDIAYITGQLGRHSSTPTERHMQAAYRALRYLQGTKTHGIIYGPQHSTLQAYADSDYASDPDTRLSTTGNIHFLNGGPISWRSTKQDTVALSTTEAEYIAASTASRHIQWLRTMIRELTSKQQPTTVLHLTDPTTLSLDNQSAIKIAQRAEKTRKSKRIDARRHYIKQQRKRGALETKHTPTEEMRADFLTKQLTPTKFTNNLKQCNITAE